MSSVHRLELTAVTVLTTGLLEDWPSTETSINIL